MVALARRVDPTGVDDVNVDVVRGELKRQGSLHPVTLMRQILLREFRHLGFTVYDGPEIDLDFYNFSALNMPEDHPARDMQDTFFIKKGGEKGDIALRTHTSSVQVRMMEAGKPPFRSIMS